MTSFFCWYMFRRSTFHSQRCHIFNSHLIKWCNKQKQLTNSKIFWELSKSFTHTDDREFQVKMETGVCIIGVLSNTRIQTRLNDSSPTVFTLSVLSCSVQTSLSQTANQVHGESRRRLRSTYFKPTGQHTDERKDIYSTHSNLSCRNDDRSISQAHLSTNQEKERDGEKAHK